MTDRRESSFDLLEHRWEALTEARRHDADDPVHRAALRDLAEEALLLARSSRSLRPSRLDRRVQVAATRDPTGRG